MSIDQTYKDYLSRQHIMSKLRQGSFDADILYDELTELFEARDYSTPVVSDGLDTISRLDHSSASTLKNTFDVIQQDLQVLFAEMLKLGQATAEDVERWKIETDWLDRRLIDLQDRVENLLLLSQETDGGYHSILADNFDNLFYIDQDITTASIDIAQTSVQIAEDASITKRVFLDNVSPTRDIKFHIYNNQNFLGRQDASGTNISDPFRQDTRAWWTTVYTNAPKPVACELTIKLGDIAFDLTKISINIHAAIAGSDLHITPLLSTDGETFTQLPIAYPLVSSKDKANFIFPKTSARFLKLLLVKDGPDDVGTGSQFIYHFGFKQISLFQETFGDASESTTPFILISKPRYAIGADQLARDFKKCTLEACEDVPENTEIKYFIAASNDSQVPLDETLRWIPIDPINRETTESPQVLTLGDFDEFIYGDDEDLVISYDVDGTTYKNPNDAFDLASLLGDDIITEEIVATEQRYELTGANNALLSLQLKEADTGSGTGVGFELDLDNLLIFRNIGEQGIDYNLETSHVRDCLRGWKFIDPWYETTIQVTNPNGMTIDVGKERILIDGKAYINKVGPSILTGRGDSQNGVHVVRVHKDNWVNVVLGADSVPDLKRLDPLYPFNHKLLIEGYGYGSNIQEHDKLYRGADIFAESLMKQVSVFDFYQNVSAINYRIFALDKDAPNTHTGNNLPTRVFLVKFDNGTTDFLNERFLLKLTKYNTLYKYLRLKAELRTEDDSVTPVLMGYKIKIG